jgi:NAD-dependent dihydropyrimidine dehydrogenase PreA subunit
VKIDEDKCIGCFECVACCPVSAIKEDRKNNRATIVHDECVECSVCLRSAGCPTDALFQPDMTYPRLYRAEFSDPAILKAGVTGRGTEETKTNDVTGRYRRGYIGIAAELGRPGIGTRFYDLEKVAQAILPLGVGFEKENPTYGLFEDINTGKLKDGIGQERVLSAILEFKVPVEKATQVLKALQEVAKKVDTVITVDIASRFDADGTLPAEIVSRQNGMRIRPNGKTNLGLGRPFVES